MSFSEYPWCRVVLRRRHQESCQGRLSSTNLNVSLSYSLSYSSSYESINQCMCIIRLLIMFLKSGCVGIPTDTNQTDSFPRQRGRPCPALLGQRVSYRHHDDDEILFLDLSLSLDHHRRENKISSSSSQCSDRRHDYVSVEDDSVEPPPPQPVDDMTAVT